MLLPTSNTAPFHFFSLGSFTISLRAADNVTVTIKLKAGVSSGCQIIVKNTFSSSLRIRPGETVTFTFTCSTPEKYFIMEIQKNIGKMRVSISSPHGGFLPVKPHTFFFSITISRYLP